MWGNGHLLANCTDRARSRRFVGQRSIAREGIPKKHRRIPPTPLGPPTPVGCARICCGEHSKSKAPEPWIVCSKSPIGHHKAFQLAIFAMFVDAGLAFRPLLRISLNRVVDGECDSNRYAV